MSQVYNGTNVTDIPLNVERGDDLTVTVCDQNDVSSCQVLTPGMYVPINPSCVGLIILILSYSHPIFIWCYMEKDKQ